MTIKVVIIGSGPAGLYTADALLEIGKAQSKDYRIDIIERLPSPFGLIRFGVAPDHQSTKKIIKVFERTVLRDEVTYLGNVEVGRDVSLEELRELYDAVVLAVGAGYDRPLGVRGDEMQGVYGSASFVGWGNSHPDLVDLAPLLDVKAVVVIGNGNVALDVARVLVKTPEEMATSDLSLAAAEAIAGAPLNDVFMVGRRGPVDAKFTNVELREMGELVDCAPVVDPAVLPADAAEIFDARDRRLRERNLATLRSFAEMSPEGTAKRCHFLFYASPVEILGDTRVTGVRFERTKVVDGAAVGSGEFFAINCGVVIAAIGYVSHAVDGAPYDQRQAIVPSDDGRVEPGLYVAGWIKRGPSGVISTNKGDGKKVAQLIDADIRDCGRPGADALTALLAERGARIVTYADWQVIEAAEIAGAAPPAPRRKFTTVAEMLAVLDGGK
jgi:NADPH-dependent glutamate synthase beta subunit-like oxidoreductase